MVGGSFVAPLVEILGDVYIGRHSFVTNNTILRAEPEQHICIGSRTNVQDNARVSARHEAIHIGDESSLAHHGIVRDSQLGDFVFIGFNAQVRRSIVEDGAFILHGAYIEGVTVPKDRLVGVGQVVLTQEVADALPVAPRTTEEFRRKVLDVNAEFAQSYIEMYETEGYDALVAISPSPSTSFNPKRIEPQIGQGVELREFAWVVGDVRLGAGSTVSQRAAIRADEGAPIVIGSNATVGNRVTFHALQGTEIRIGSDLTAQDDTVLHGPLAMGDNVRVGEWAVVFRVNVEDNVVIGEAALVVGPPPEDGDGLLTIPAGTVIPDEAVITSEEDLRDVLRGGLGSRDPKRDSLVPGTPNAGRSMLP